MNKRIKIIIGLLMFAAFAVASFITIFWQLFIILYILGMVMIIWFIIKLLRYPTSSNRTFDKYFYDDLNIKIMDEKKLKMKE
jgi:threonine/homoserine/homoserine lactone efflux protein